MLPQFDSEQPDEFQDLLRDLERLPATRADLAESIFAQTRGVLSQRRWLRRGRFALACLVCYALGISSTWLLSPRPAGQIAGPANVGPPERIEQAPQRRLGIPDQSAPGIDVARRTDEKAVVSGSTVAGTNPTPRQDVPKAAATNGPPAMATAEVAPTGRTQFENFRRAGDRQLFERGDIRAATDCYRRALTHATERDLNVAVDRDSWLLSLLKQSRLEERRHVRQKRV